MGNAVPPPRVPTAVPDVPVTAGVLTNPGAMAHYAGHAVFDDERPELSYLLLAPSQGGDGRLTAAQIDTLELGQVRLVVLSSCRTAGRTGRHDRALEGERWIRRSDPVGQRPLGVTQLPDKQQAPRLQMPRMGCVGLIPMSGERGSCVVQLVRGPAEIARNQRDLGLRHHAARAGHGFVCAEGSAGAIQQVFRQSEIAEPRHGDTPQRKRRRVAAQCDAVECAKDVSGRKRARRCRDQRVHRHPAKNPATLVTLTLRMIVPTISPRSINNPLKGVSDD